tara:strand:- start:391 stop:831 length:441 start_codon:yes stop_codon:yes gene_type:complete
MIYSRPCEYALRALTYITVNSDSELIRTQEIAEAEGLPAPFLAKLLQQLARSGILVSVKGPKGGFGLARPPKEISLLEVVTAIDGEDGFMRCAIGLAECTDTAPCPLHDTWKPLRDQILDYMAGRSLSNLAEAITRKKELIDRAEW